MLAHYQETDSKIIFTLPQSDTTCGEAKTPLYHNAQFNETIGGKLYEDYYSSTGEVNLIKSAMNAIQCPENPDIVEDAKRLLLTINEIFINFRQFGFELGYLPPLYASIVEDGSILIEWIFNYFRIGFSIEPNKDDSCWYLVSNSNLGEISASGYISNININTLLLWLFNFVISNS